MIIITNNGRGWRFNEYAQSLLWIICPCYDLRDKSSLVRFLQLAYTYQPSRNCRNPVTRTITSTWSTLVWFAVRNQFSHQIWVFWVKDPVESHGWPIRPTHSRCVHISLKMKHSWSQILGGYKWQYPSTKKLWRVWIPMQSPLGFRPWTRLIAETPRVDLWGIKYGCH